MFALLREVVIIIWVDPKHMICFSKFIELFRVQRCGENQFGHPVEERKSPEHQRDDRVEDNPEKPETEKPENRSLTAGKLTDQRNNLLETFFSRISPPIKSHQVVQVLTLHPIFPFS